MGWEWKQATGRWHNELLLARRKNSNKKKGGETGAESEFHRDAFWLGRIERGQNEALATRRRKEGTIVVRE